MMGKADWHSIMYCDVKQALSSCERYMNIMHFIHENGDIVSYHSDIGNRSVSAIENDKIQVHRSRCTNRAKASIK